MGTPESLRARPWKEPARSRQDAVVVVPRVVHQKCHVRAELLGQPISLETGNKAYIAPDRTQPKKRKLKISKKAGQAIVKDMTGRIHGRARKASRR
jgi:hypothetical protein